MKRAHGQGPSGLWGDLLEACFPLSTPTSAQEPSEQGGAPQGSTAGRKKTLVAFFPFLFLLSLF